MLLEWRRSTFMNIVKVFKISTARSYQKVKMQHENTEILLFHQKRQKD